ncbi:hypothetical protein BDW74DRAFT_160430 [Aspergillus multicolor]|uniref:uncharacterized protein n=1 Tax=Aspergillus multicolor TaxID=41759 RepID=UPI003CCDC96A
MFTLPTIEPEVANTHSALLSSLNTFYNTLLTMQYLREEDLLYPSQLSQKINLHELISAGYILETIALLLQLPQTTTDTTFEILPDETVAFPYTDLSSLLTISGEDNPRDPLDHYEEENWVIPPWTFFLTVPRPQREVVFPYCRIYDTQSRILGVWSESMVIRPADDRGASWAREAALFARRPSSAGCNRGVDILAALAGVGSCAL